MTSGSGWARRVASFYSRSAPRYEELWAPELLALARELLSELPLGSADRVLDVGSGVGGLLADIESRARNGFVVGSDISFGMLHRAPERYARVVSDAQHLPFADSAFAVVSLAFMLFHVPEPDRALKEVRRILRDGGAIGTVTWGTDPSYLALDVWNEELAARGADTTLEISRHDLVDSEEKVTQLLEVTGYSGVRTWVGRREDQMTLESFLNHRMGHGMSRCRFESLPGEVRAEVVQTVTERLRSAPPSAFLDRSEVIYATAIAAGDIF